MKKVCGLYVHKDSIFCAICNGEDYSLPTNSGVWLLCPYTIFYKALCMIFFDMVEFIEENILICKKNIYICTKKQY